MKATRREILSQARALGADEVRRLSAQVVARFQASCAAGIPKQAGWPRAGSGLRGLKVGLYRAQDHECDVRALESWLEERGALLFFPRLIDDSGCLLELAAKPSAGQAWVRSAYDIEEPGPGCAAVDPGALGLILVPGVAFGSGGERLGRGKGYYDRYLARAPQALRVALAFDFQILPALPQNPWDQRVNWIFSEKREIRVP